MSTPLRLVITGCGGIAAAWLDNLVKRDDVTIVGFVDLDPKRAAERAETYAKGAATGTDLAQMIDRVKPDAVCDLTIPDMSCPRSPWPRRWPMPAASSRRRSPPARSMR
jgi:predicted dehydrogenase